MQAVQKMCNTGIYLQKGRLVEQADIGRIVSRYLSSGDSASSVYEFPVPSEVSLGYATHLFIEDANGARLDEIPVGSDWRARIIFKLLKPSEHFIMGFGIVSSFDQPIRTSWSEPRDMMPGDYEMIFDNNDVMLTSGIYKLAVGLSSNKRAFHYDDQTAGITISDAGDVASNSRIVNTQSGLILNPMPVKLNKLN
jgi:hypothetical protein